MIRTTHEEWGLISDRLPVELVDLRRGSRLSRTLSAQSSSR